jgi:outer membrane protein
VKRFAAALLVLVACRSYAPPAIEELYRDELRWTGHEAFTTASPIEPVWDRVRRQNHLTLADAFQITLARSERIARAAESFLQSMTLRDRATAAFLPTIGITATQFFQEDVAATGGGATSTSSDRREARATISQPLFRGLRDFAGWRQTIATIDQRRSFFETERRLVFQLVALNFYNTLFLERQVRILEDSLKNTRDRLREMQARRDQGIARKTEVLLIETQVASDETLLTRARLALELARTQLAFLLGRPVDVPLHDDMPESAAPADLEPLLQEALAQRSDLREREAAVQSAEENIRVISGEHLPSIDLSANFYMYREGFSTSARGRSKPNRSTASPF